ncbi:hypothetical protein [Rhizobium sp. BK176]|uniref:hypothetical protein n=1 Tax=Rhizobium sp. BK176 TaxID=2587071 RepID=UPI002168E027|nr:hypothetical protein [Rhizobium sp. BK176]MCS4089691.1 hypothetical protein [Rhizobium sp. BK176]
MKATIPFAYTAQVMFPRSDAPKDEVFVETLEIDVPEYRSGDIPVAMTYRWRGGNPGNPVYLLNDQFLTSGRSHATISVDQLHPHPGMNKFNLVQQHLYDYSSKQLNVIAAWYKDGRAGRDPSKVTDWIRSDREEALDTAKSFFDGMVSLDGVLVFETSEPTIRVTPGQSTQVSVASFDIGKKNLRGHPLSSPPFHITQAADAIRFAQARYGNAPLEVHFDPTSLDIAIPAAFTFEIGRYSLEWAASELFEALCANIRHVPDNRIEEWQLLRRLMAEKNSSGWEHDVVPVVEALIPLVRNGPQRKSLSAMLQVWADHDVVDVAFGRRQIRP